MRLCATEWVSESFFACTKQQEAKAAEEGSFGTFASNTFRINHTIDFNHEQLIFVVWAPKKTTAKCWVEYTNTKEHWTGHHEGVSSNSRRRLRVSLPRSLWIDMPLIYLYLSIPIYSCLWQFIQRWQCHELNREDRHINWFPTLVFAEMWPDF